VSAAGDLQPMSLPPLPQYVDPTDSLSGCTTIFNEVSSLSSAEDFLPESLRFSGGKSQLKSRPRVTLPSFQEMFQAENFVHSF
jgi:hypothetical protein